MKETVEKYIEDINELGFKEKMFLNSRDVAKVMNVKQRTIVTWRRSKISKSPKFMLVGKSYLYNKRDLAEFLATATKDK